MSNEVVRQRGHMRIEEFHRMLDAIAKGSEELPDLPTESFSRESFYEGRPVWCVASDTPRSPSKS